MSTNKEYVVQPIESLRDLLNFNESSASWRKLVAPVAPRSKSRYLGERYHQIDFDAGNEGFVDNRNRPQVLLCHDYKGNYLADKFINGATGEAWAGYRFYNWAAIDIFCYFSHSLVTIPTLQWLNCAHQHGVKVIGTFIIERDSLLSDLLQSPEFASKIAESLVTVAKVCQFEGWLLNIEARIQADKIPLLIDFVSQLTKLTHEAIPQSRVIWYDAIAVDGTLRWQNELNGQNDAFFAASDGIFLNYSWSKQNLERTDNFIQNYYKDRKLDVLVGIDVFGRNQVAQLETHKTLARIAQFGFSVAIFAPGWTHESLEEAMQKDRLDLESRNSLFLNRNDSFWNLLWKHIFVQGPHTLPFYTSFCLGSGPFQNRLGKRVSGPWFNLTLQKYQPTIPYSTRQNAIPVTWTHDFSDAVDGGSCLRIATVQPNCRLFACHFDCALDLIMAYAFKRSSEQSADVDIFLKAYNARYHESLKVVCGCGDSGNAIMRDHEILAHPLDEENRQALAQLAGARLDLPPVPSINGWEIRYYYLSFEDINEPMSIVDIGIEIKKDDPKDYILLGALSLLAGFPANRSRIRKRSLITFN